MIDPKELDEIGRWSEVKLEIIEKYARPYLEIVNKSGFESTAQCASFYSLISGNVD